MNTRNFVLRAGVSAIAFTWALTGVAQAQEAIEEIVVTAQKREQKLLDVPIAVTAIGSQELVRSGATDLRDLQALTPSLNITTNNNDATTAAIRIRGIGTTGNNPGFEGAVGTFVDGIYRSRSGVALTELYDLKRVEVLRGPQGTLFGKNTSVGALNVITNEPEFQFGANAQIEGGNYNLTSGRAAITGPVGNKVAVRLAGFLTRRDGWQHNVTNGTDASDRNRFGGRGQILFKPSGTFSFKITADYYQANETGSAAPFTSNPGAPIGTVLTAFGARYFVPPRPFEGQFAINQPLKQNTNDWGIAGEMNWKLGFATLTNIAAYRQFQNYVNFDSDFSGADFLGPRNEVFNVKQFSEELRLAGRVDDMGGFGHALNWLIGGYFAKEQIGDSQSTVYGQRFGSVVSALSGGGIPAALYPPGAGGQRFLFAQDGTTWSFFTHETWEVTPKLSVTGGVRYNHESKTGSGRLTYADNVPGPGCFLNSGNPTLNGLINNLCPAYNFDGKTSESELTGTGSLSYKWTDQVTTFFSYSHGYKAGGINLDRGAGGYIVSPITGAAQPRLDPTFKPEFSDNYEVGLKTQFGRTTVNFAAFYTDFSDFQLNTFTGLGFIVSNVKAVNSKGVELEVATNPFKWLALTGGGSYVIAKYGDELATDPVAANRPLAGRIITNAPRLTLNGSATFTKDIPATIFASFLRLEASYHSALNTGSDLAAQKAQGPVFLTNGRLGLTADQGKYELSVWARNIFNREYKTLVIDSPFQTGGFNSWIGEPRTYGVTARLNF